MFCPNCGKACGDGKFCAECGTRLPVCTEDLETKAPEGVYRGLDGWIELSFYTLTFYKERQDKTQTQSILYGDISGMAFRQAAGEEIGYLAVRDRRCRKPLAQTESDAACDETAILFAGDMNEVFQEIYKYLEQRAGKKQATENNEPEEIPLRGAPDSAELIRCPKCNSERHITYKPKLRVSKMLLLGPMWLYANSRRRKTYECLNCGRRWLE